VRARPLQDLARSIDHNQLHCVKHAEVISNGGSHA
jgi:hypothetical protein